MNATWPTAEPLSTSRLELEPLRIDHAAEMEPVLADPRLYAYTGGAPPSRTELVDRYARQAKGASPDGTEGWSNWMLRLRETGGLVGYVQASLREREAELAWVVSPEEQGQGLATEAVGAVIDWLTATGVSPLVAHIHPDNRPSVALAERAGFVATAELRDGELRWIQ